MGRGEYLVGQAIKGRRDQAFLSVKCGAMFSPTGAFSASMAARRR
ncbi:hypothetical protein [Citrobacter sp. RHB25-C09]|nr:hypothetical protein [Citrobacter sp. RHB25-C09]